VEQAKEKLKHHINEAIASISGFDERARPLRIVARYIEERKE
jgi:hypothetical protein